MLDRLGRIFDEYRGRLSFSGEPGFGYAFIRWAFHNRGREDLVQAVPITPRGNHPGDCLEFPTDPALDGFRRKDRQFVAAPLSPGGNPPILNVTDSDRWDYRNALQRAAMTVKFVGPDRFGNRAG